ncbi:AAA-ATPase At2g18193 isoform X1 [Ricinus communis]|uniref:Mitochondrial chaperone BCS1, putative n=1 Tax=Ricinus communis TaxID=3988 RepID=B9S6B6_RICCO|nr:AAA-ATPase At2g18193 isoform X1 [Ricinus communis]EEF40806.1 Mitochondrial chaperone BCS1, putative [Ricinus communis]
MQSFSFLESTRMFPSTSSLLSLYASFSTSLMLLRNAYHELVPKKLESFLVTKICILFSRRKSPSFDTFIIDDSWDGLDRNKLIDAARFYLSSKIDRKNKVIRVGKFRGQENVTAALVEGEKIVDVFDGIEITWQFAKEENNDRSGKNNDRFYNKGYFEITFEDQHREKVFHEYLKHILIASKVLTQGEKVLKLFTRSRGCWNCIDFRHPSTFDALAMDHDLKKSIIDDLNRFLSRKEFYKRIGKAWKRGYLLYGPPGTGKSSLIAAMANYLKFDVYDLELANIHSDADLRKAMLDIDRKSITVIEDIDCNTEAHARSKSKSSSDDSDDETSFVKQFSLSALLNCIDGLWSSCGEERIIVFTTNHKEVLDPALLRPGRMDMHIHMSYCTPQGFRILASNYLEIKDHFLFEEIDGLIRSTEVTPASLAEELLKSDDADLALEEVLNFLKLKKMEKHKVEEEKKMEKGKVEEEKKMEKGKVEKTE